ncbi:temperature dependent protein affecting M2 dsRNA replication-domain-containing protein [Neocallimastix lanati (nom. inval.)]|nr:temperature dependent protein affecting M2 dsRNA replication-domain-containing protein [Neocallimastix sp. JGI-2020a]
MCQGMVSPQVITNLVSGMLLEGPPLCNGDTIEYREFIKSQSLLDLRTQALSLLTMGMSKFMRNRRVNSIFWFEPSNEVQLHHESEPVGVRWLPPNKIAQINDSKQNDKENENENENSHEEDKEKEKSRKNSELAVKANTPPVYSLTNNIDWFTPYGKALQKALSVMPSSSIFQEEIVTALELIRMNALNNRAYNKVPYSKPEHINLISRVASLLHISFKTMVVWKGPLDLELLRFNSFMKAVTRSLRNLCEMILLSMTMNENAGKSDSNLEILSAGIKLPFLLDANTANGIITKDYLDSLTDIINITPEVIQKSTTNVENRFKEYCDDVKSDMENTYKLWDCILEAVKSLKADGQINEEYAKEFIDANEWLKGKRPIFN